MGTWTTKLRIAAAGTAAMILGVAGSPAMAGEEAPSRKASRHETVGVASGLTIGALAGGPFGAVIGAAAGAWLGDRYHRESSGRRAALGELASERARSVQLGGRVSELDATLASERVRAGELAALLDRVHELETDIAFRTEDASVSSDAAMKLSRLGTLLAAMPETRVRIAGFADPRGTEGYNLELSGRRAAAVVNELQNAGVPAERLIVEAHGESMASSPEGDADAQALERRVTIRVERADVAVARGDAIR